MLRWSLHTHFEVLVVFSGPIKQFQYQECASPSRCSLVLMCSLVLSRNSSVSNESAFKPVILDTLFRLEHYPSAQIVFKTLVSSTERCDGNPPKQVFKILC